MTRVLITVPVLRHHVRNVVQCSVVEVPCERTAIDRWTNEGGALDCAKPDCNSQSGNTANGPLPSKFHDQSCSDR
jgi:hypothetical protein